MVRRVEWRGGFAWSFLYCGRNSGGLLSTVNAMTGKRLVCWLESANVVVIVQICDLCPSRHVAHKLFGCRISLTVSNGIKVILSSLTNCKGTKSSVFTFSLPPSQARPYPFVFSPRSQDQRLFDEDQ